MNFQELVNTFYAPTCIISVEKTENGRWGEIRLVAGNQKYLEPIEHPVYTLPSGEVIRGENTFIPNSLYEKYLPKDIGFEDICFRAAVQKTPVHTYVHMNYISLWFDIFIMPIDYEDGNICYCTYTAKPSNAADVGFSSDDFGGTSEDVLKTCIKLHGTNDFNQTMQEVIKDIRILSRAEASTILLIDPNKESYSLLAMDFEKNSRFKGLTEFSNFYEIIASWDSMLSGKDCIIIKNENDMQQIYNSNPAWYHILKEAGIENTALFPLRQENEILGFIWVTNFNAHRTMRMMETLELTTFFISSKIASYKMMERLKLLSYSDLLTKLPNRFACYDMMTDLIKHQEPFTIVSIDLNHFKSINETMGFETGNKVLVQIANRWKMIAENHLSGTKDTITHINGDEFALMIQNYQSGEEVLKTIKQYESVLAKRLTIDECDFYITASFGYAEFPTDADNTDSMMSYASAAMREVKWANSSNHIIRFTPDLLKTERILEIENKIRTALENDTIYFNLQPQYDMNHKLRGFEALARMKDADGSFISPGEFIPIAEKVGLIDKVDSAVFRKSTAFFGNLLKKSGADFILSINVSVRHLMKNDFLEEIRELLNTGNVPANALEIEITESIMIDSAEKALKCIHELKNMGIKIAIDDFGTGYSSLSYLNRFPANLLKIDKSFIDKMNTSDSSKQYVAAIISIGHIMGVDVISEGVEEQEQLETLRSIGCDFI